MKRLIVEPDGWPLTYAECPPGFFTMGDSLFFKSEYGGDGYCDTGEYFVGGVDAADRGGLIVQPVMYRWVDEEV